MILLLYDYKCAKCGNVFHSPELPGNPYGEFLLRNEVGDIKYLNAIDDEVFKNVSNLLKKNTNIFKSSDIKSSKILHKIFGATCDAIFPDKYQINKFPYCPKCGSDIMYSWGPTNPPQFIEKDVKPVTHEQWNQLTEERKTSLIKREEIKYFLFSLIPNIRKWFWIWIATIREGIHKKN